MAARLAISSRAARHLANLGSANVIYGEVAAAASVPSFRLPAAKTAGTVLSRRFNSNGPEKIVQIYEKNNPSSAALSQYIKALISLELQARGGTANSSSCSNLTELVGSFDAVNDVSWKSTTKFSDVKGVDEAKA